MSREINIATIREDKLYNIVVKNLSDEFEYYVAKGSNIKFYHGIVRIEDESGKVTICDVNRMIAYSQEKEKGNEK